MLKTAFTSVAMAMAITSAATAFECEIGQESALEVGQWTAKRLDAEWTETTAILKNVSGRSIGFAVGRLFIDGIANDHNDLATMIFIERPLAPGGQVTIRGQGTGLEYLAVGGASEFTLHACMEKIVENR